MEKEQAWGVPVDRVVRIPMSEALRDHFEKHGERLLDAAKVLIDIHTAGDLGTARHGLAILNLCNAVSALDPNWKPEGTL